MPHRSCTVLGRYLAAGAAGTLAATLAMPAAPGRAATAPAPRLRQLAAGGFSAYALGANGQVWAWGDDMEGQLGNGSDNTASDVPLRVVGISRASALAASDNTAYALGEGKVWAWGDDGQGQAANGKTAYSQQRPEVISHLNGVTEVAAGGYSAYALGASGKVWAWGDNSMGQLGRSLSVTGAVLPHRVARLAGVERLIAGESTAYALRKGGTVWAWGDDAFGELGQRLPTPASPEPLRLARLRGVVMIAASAFTGFALARSGTVWAWGDGSFGLLGARQCRVQPRRRCLPSSVPVRVSGLGHVVAIAAGGQSAYALAKGGTVWAWGGNTYGQLGNGSTRASTRPVRVARLHHVVSIAAGGSAGYALEADGTVWAWGDNSYGQLGNGTTVSSAIPVRVRF